VRSSWQLGHWRGVPITLHWTVLLALPWFLYQTRSLVGTAIAFIAFFGLLLAHEVGHAAVAMWRRVEVLWIRLLVIHGECAHEEPDYELDDVLIAWGGVAAQLVLLIAALGVDMLLAPTSSSVYRASAPLLHVFIETNLVIMIVNLIPLAPFDGATAWRILPILADWANGTHWAAKARWLAAARERSREKKIEAKSERITAEIIDKLKKGKRDA